MHRCSRLLARLKTKALLFFRILDSDREPLLPPNLRQFRQIPALGHCCKALIERPVLTQDRFMAKTFEKYRPFYQPGTG